MKTFEFSRKGLNECLEYVDYIGIVRERLDNSPQLFPLVLSIAVIGITALTSPMASTVAYKTMIAEQVAFKLININL